MIAPVRIYCRRPVYQNRHLRENLKSPSDHDQSTTLHHGVGRPTVSLDILAALKLSIRFPEPDSNLIGFCSASFNRLSTSKPAECFIVKADGIRERNSGKQTIRIRGAKDALYRF